MSIKGIIFIALAAIGVVINFTSRSIAEKTSIPQLKIKITALFIVLIAVILLFIFGK